jgi:hypothetical protein
LDIVGAVGAFLKGNIIILFFKKASLVKELSKSSMILNKKIIQYKSFFK